MTVKSKELTEQGLIDLAGVKVYIAGPMSGLAMLNRPAFFAAEAYLQGQGARVMNPAVLPDGWDHDAYLHADHHTDDDGVRCSCLLTWLAAEQGIAASIHPGTSLWAGSTAA